MVDLAKEQKIREQNRIRAQRFYASKKEEINERRRL
jgi:hypothetical protein